MRQIFVPTLLLTLTLLLCLLPSQGREADDRSRFLYADDPIAASIILEYQLHNAPPEDYDGDERKESSRKQPGAEYDEEKHIKPYMLKADNNIGPRVVQFYSPWSGYCQSYKSKYIDLANELKLRNVEYQQPEVTFHAISCSVYHWVCQQNNIRGYPTIIAYKANSAIPMELNTDPSADDIAEAVGVALKPLDQDIAKTERNDDAFSPPLDILGASVDGMVRTKEAAYVDAALSFIHALRTEVFTDNDNNNNNIAYLNSDRRETFSDWIDLLYWSLPPTWILHTLINDLRNNIDAVMSNRENLLYIVDKHVDVVITGSKTWSTHCTDGSNGYACGLWSLFHIVSIGVIERHRAVLGARDQISTKFVARTLRNYVQHFFFSCPSCQRYFIEMYDNCGFNHCKRLKQPKKLPSPESWNEFALWLWEVHNDVNVKVLEAEAGKDGRIVTREEIMEQTYWPSHDLCSDCRDKRGKWNTDAVLSQLKRQYWPGGVQNFRFIVLKKKVIEEEENPYWVAEFIEDAMFIAIFAVIVVWFSRRQYISFTGRHKKYEQDYV